MTVRELRSALFDLHRGDAAQDSPVDLAQLLALASGDGRLPVMLCEILTPIAEGHDHDPGDPSPDRVRDAVELMKAFGWL